MSEANKCPLCGAAYHYVVAAGWKFLCGTIIRHVGGPHVAPECLRRQFATPAELDNAAADDGIT